MAVCSAFLAEVDARLPGWLVGLFLHGSLAWGEFHPGSDIDFVGMWDRLPIGQDLDLLGAAHKATVVQHSGIAFNGFRCTRQDLAMDPDEVGTRPVFYEGEFAPAGTIDINQVTWCELAHRPVVIRGREPPVHCDTDALVDFT